MTFDDPGEIAVSDSESFLFSLVDDIQRRRHENGFETLSEKEQAFAAIWELEAEVNNGGFEQYFWNSLGDHSRAAVVALRAIGAPSTAILLEQAMALFGDEGPSPQWFQRQDQMDALSAESSARFGELDQKFYEYEDDLSALLARFMRAPS